jgi:mRNA interferase RelE/StbE
MASFEIEWKHSAARELRKLPKDIVARVVAAVEALATDPHPVGALKLAGSQHTYRIREGSYRIIYEVDATTVVITIIRVAHRREVYRR